MEFPAPIKKRSKESIDRGRTALMKKNDAKAEDVCAAYLNNETIASIRKKFDIATRSLYALIKRNGIALKSPQARKVYKKKLK